MPDEVAALHCSPMPKINGRQATVCTCMTQIHASVITLSHYLLLRNTFECALPILTLISHVYLAALTVDRWQSEKFRGRFFLAFEIAQCLKERFIFICEGGKVKFKHYCTPLHKTRALLISPSNVKHCFLLARPKTSYKKNIYSLCLS